MPRARTVLALVLAGLSLVSSAQAQPLAPTMPAPQPPAAPPAASPGAIQAPDGSAAVSGQLPGLSFSGELLWLRPHRDGLAIGALSTGPSSAVESLSWSDVPAFRIGAGYRFSDCNWDTSASFTYFHAKDQRTVSAEGSDVLIGALSPRFAVKQATDADGDAGLGYAVLDLDVGKGIRIDDSFGLRLFAGARLAWIEQSLKCIYSGGALGDTSDYVNSPVHFHGAGVSAGAEGNWNIWRGWGLYGKGRLALVSGQFSSRRSETLGTTLISNGTDNFETVVPVAELGVGLGYQGEHFFFRAGYELTNWTNVVNSLAPPNVAAGALVRQRGDLSLEALTVKVGFTF